MLFIIKIANPMKIKSFLLLLLLSFFHGLRAEDEAFKAFSRFDYYTDEKEGAVVVLIPEGRRNDAVEVRLFFNGKIMNSVSAEHAPHVLVPFNVATLPEGETKLICKVFHENHEISTISVKVKKLPPKDNAVRIDRLTGGLEVDGLPFFPFGFYCGSPVGTLPEEEIVRGFNMIGPYQKNTPKTMAERKVYMDRCAQLGMKVHYAVNGLIGDPHNKTRKHKLSQEERFEILRQEIIAFRDHPALLAWYINDEPLGQSRPVALLEEAYRIVKELDPYHPASIVFMMPHRADEFGHTLDIAMTDPYPLPAGPDMVRLHVRDLQRHFRHQKSVWLVPQAFGGGEMWTRGPTRGEMRVMTYIGLVEGATGIQYFIRRGPNLSPKAVDAWNEAGNMAVEVHEMTPFLLSGEPAPVIKTDNEKILARAWRHHGKILILAVNTANEPSPVSLTLEGLPLNGTAGTVFENRQISMENSQIHDYIAAFGTLAYVIEERKTDEKTAIFSSNLVLSPSFEDNASPGTPGECYAGYETARGDPGATYFIESRLAVHGTHSLRLVTPVDSGGIKLRFFHVDLQPGQAYNLSIWAKAREAVHLPSFGLTVTNTDVARDFILDSRWKKYVINFELKEPVARPSVTLALHTAGTTWFDLLQVASDPEISYSITSDGRARVFMQTLTEGATLRYTLNGKTPDARSKIYSKPLTISKPVTVKAGLFADGGMIVKTEKFIPVHKALNKKVLYEMPYTAKYPSADGEGTLTNGKLAGLFFRDPEWQGFGGTDVEVVIDLGDEVTIGKVSGDFLISVNDGIHAPVEVIVECSKDGKNFMRKGQLSDIALGRQGAAYRERLTVPLGKVRCRYIRFIAKNTGKIPAPYLFKGTDAWLFMDEVIVE